jgi:hypothetical protein
MRKINNYVLAFIAIFLMSFLFADNLNAQKPHSDVFKTSIPIVIDGELDEIWSKIEPNDIENNISNADYVDYSYWKACWDDDGIYIVVVVDDDNYWPSELSGLETHQSDKPELYFDVNEILEDGNGGKAGIENGHYQFAPTFIGAKDGEIQYGEGIAETCEYAHKVTGESYVFEYFIPFSFLENAPEFDKTRMMGFDVTVIDRDEIEDKRKKFTWANREEIASSYNNMDDCGTIILINDLIDITSSAGIVSDYNKTKKSNAYISNNVLYLNGVKGSIVVYDTYGKVVLKNDKNSSEIYVNTLKNGIYIVKADNFNAKVIKK